ncbi:MAG TPA: hypothetical protein G4N92_02375 [Anaerolineae bacterium]|nr:hypothetical protein [Anaerolineae bacterium]
MVRIQAPLPNKRLIRRPCLILQRLEAAVDEASPLSALAESYDKSRQNPTV